MPGRSRCRAASDGNSRRQGGHQEAQKLSTTTRPRSEASGLPATVPLPAGMASAGAGLPSRPAGGVPVLQAESRSPEASREAGRDASTGVRRRGTLFTIRAMEQEHRPVLSVVVPAGSGEGDADLRACLDSLAAGSEPGWVLGEHWELLVVVPDGAGAAEVARAFPQARVVEATPPGEPEWRLRHRACQVGSEAARGAWLLFTTPNTVHAAGAASRAVVEAERYEVALLSYGARPVGGALIARALLPMILAEIANAYPPAQVNDGAKRIGYATSEFLLADAEQYRVLGGHGMFAASPTPEVELAFLFKRRELGVRYREAPEALSAQVETSLAAMWRGWRVKLPSLISNTPALAAWRLLDFLLLWGLLLLALLYPVPFAWERWLLWLLWLRNAWRVYRRAARSHLPAGDLLLALTLGLPLFAGLCMVSRPGGKASLR